MPLNKYREQTEDEICKGCAFLPTKPEAVPEDLTEAVAVALELAEIERGGGSFVYPDSLSSHDWAAINGLTRGRDRAESLKQERERKDNKPKPD